MGIPILTAEINRHLAQAAKTVEASSEICCAKDRPPSAHAKQLHTCFGSMTFHPVPSLLTFLDRRYLCCFDVWTGAMISCERLQAAQRSHTVATGDEYTVRRSSPDLCGIRAGRPFQSPLYSIRAFRQPPKPLRQQPSFGLCGVEVH